MDVLEQLKRILQLEKQLAEEKDKIREANTNAPNKPREPQKEPYPFVYYSPKIKDLAKPVLVGLAVDFCLLLFGVNFMNFFGIFIVLVVVPGFALLLALYAFYRFTKYRQQLILTEENKIRNSPDYQRQCIEIDRRYENAKIVYENESLPKYQKERLEWERERDEKVSQLNESIKTIEEELQLLYSDMEIIPENYRNVAGIEFICQTVENDKYTVERAVKAYMDKLSREEYFRRKRAAEERARQEEEEYYRQQEREQRADERRQFARTFVASAAGSYAGNRMANRKAEREKPKRQREDRYTCSLSCPKKIKRDSYKKNRCRLDPKTCGYGLRI